jgi:hypothetical protein
MSDPAPGIVSTVIFKNADASDEIDLELVQCAASSSYALENVY